MLAVERKNQILAILTEEKKVVVTELSQKFDVSEETIRRDLEKLEKEGLCFKAYGGAVLNESNNIDMPFMIRKKTNVFGKQMMAEIVSNLIKDGDHIMLDASSTALYIAKKIKDRKNVTLVTNSVEILVEVADVKGWRVFSSGGVMQEGSLALLGNQADKMISEFHVDKAIISCKGLDVNKSYTDSNEMHASTKNTMLKNADVKILVADSSKFGKIAFAKIGELSELDMLITDKKPSEEWISVLAKNNVELKYSEE